MCHRFRALSRPLPTTVTGDVVIHLSVDNMI